MKKSRWLLVSVLLFCAAVDQTAPGGAEAAVKRESIPWWLMQIGPGQRSLDVAFVYGGCRVNPEAEATESGGAIRIRVTVEVETGPNVACTANALVALDFPVRLKVPLAGKPVMGSTHFGNPSERRRKRVPRLVGLAPKDAAWIVRTEGLREQLADTKLHVPRPVVRSQYPAAGAAFPANKVLDIAVASPAAPSAR